MSDPSLSIEIAQLSDVEELSRFVNAAYRGDSSRVGWTTEADLLGGQRTDPEMIREQLLGPDNVFLLFKRDERLVASVFLQRRSTCAYLGMFTVDPRLQTGGIGKLALQLIEEWVAREWHLDLIEMMVITRRTELIRWYERRGYTDTGRREAFPYGDPKFGLPKFDDLEMMILDKKLSAQGRRFAPLNLEMTAEA